MKKFLSFVVFLCFGIVVNGQPLPYPASPFSRALLTNINGDGWLNALGASGGGPTNGITASTATNIAAGVVNVYSNTATAQISAVSTSVMGLSNSLPSTYQPLSTNLTALAGGNGAGLTNFVSLSSMAPTNGTNIIGVSPESNAVVIPLSTLATASNLTSVSNSALKTVTTQNSASVTFSGDGTVGNPLSATASGGTGGSAKSWLIGGEFGSTTSGQIVQPLIYSPFSSFSRGSVYNLGQFFLPYQVIATNLYVFPSATATLNTNSVYRLATNGVPTSFSVSFSSIATGVFLCKSNLTDSLTILPGSSVGLYMTNENGTSMTLFGGWSVEVFPQ